MGRKFAAELLGTALLVFIAVGVATLSFGFGADGSRPVALLPVSVTEARADARRGEPVTVLLRSGHMLKVGRDFDEQTFARVVALLERG